MRAKSPLTGRHRIVTLNRNTDCANPRFRGVSAATDPDFPWDAASIGGVFGQRLAIGTGGARRVGQPSSLLSPSDTGQGGQRVWHRRFGAPAVRPPSAIVALKSALAGRPSARPSGHWRTNYLYRAKAKSTSATIAT
jgi:hypothetical protein